MYWKCLVIGGDYPIFVNIALNGRYSVCIIDYRHLRLLFFAGTRLVDMMYILNLTISTKHDNKREETKLSVSMQGYSLIGVYNYKWI